ncbi:MAG: transporter [Candidatus Scalinduaceae bacterium]
MKKYIISLYFFTVIILGASIINRADAQGPPINTQTAFVTGIEGGAIRSFGKSTKLLGSLPGGRGEFNIISIPLIIPYELLPNKLVVGASIPYLDKEKKTTIDGERKSFSDSGFGDLTLFGKYQFFQRDAHAQTTRMSALGRLKLPTGDDDEKRGGARLPPSVQLGTGSVDYGLGLIFTHIKGRFGINADLIYTINTEANDFEFGDTLNYDIAFGYRVLPSVYETYPAKQLNLYLEFNGKLSQKNKQNDKRVDDSGRNTIFLSPGIQFIPRPNFLIEASFQKPIYEDLRGNQLDTDYSFNIGFRWLLF